MKKIFLILLLMIWLLPGFSASATSEVLAVKPVDIYFFYADGCPHCAKEEIFLDQLKKDLGEKISVHYYEVRNNRDNAKLLYEVSQIHPLQIGGVPITLIGSQHIIGYQDDATTGQQILRLINDCEQGLVGECPAKKLLDGKEDNAQPESQPKSRLSELGPQLIKIPLIGEIDATKFSLPVLSVVIGLLDGFNPCAMWVLIFLISLLLGVDSNRRRWLIGSIFIIASGMVYFVFMAAWLNAILFLSYLWYIRAGIALFAIIFGLYNLRQYWRERKIETTCKVTGNEKRRRTFDRLKNLVQEKNLLVALIGIAALAFAVNLVELACSAGFPAIFTAILAYNGTPTWQHYLYILIYILFYIIDDIIVFIIAMITLQTTTISTKYAKYSNLIGGVVILLLGLVLLFRPEWLLWG
jgi:thiol-disulfide isomerase/thioredoxin